ncbi:MAG: endonuclease III [Candidatus Aminicenantes bacterium]|nr:endonuclease III [Candidatus Aminicenantes bacterium]
MEGPRKRIGPIVRILRRTYPGSRTALEFRSPLQILVATILSAQCTDDRVNSLTPALFRKYGTAADFAAADRTELETEIRPAGFFRNKAKSIVGAAGRIVSVYGGAVPGTMEELLTLPGVARKTANIVLAAGFGRAEGIAVDVHVARLAGRLGLSREKVPEKIERDLLRIVPRGDWLDFNFMLVNHGRAVCRARKPLCAACPLGALCPSAGQLCMARAKVGAGRKSSK